MPGLFSRLKGLDGGRFRSKKYDPDRVDHLPAKPRWEDAWLRTSVNPDEVQELVHCCTEELKARALNHPFLLLPYRPTSNPSAVKTFIRHFFDPAQAMNGNNLVQELRMNEPMVISGVVKWCWSRLRGGVVGWEAYELFRIGEQDSEFARDSFKTFIPLSVDNNARSCIIFDFFELMSAIAAHGKINGLGGRKLSRMAAWWAFDHRDNGNGFEGGYNAWLRAADATSHLFFAHLRSLAPSQARGAISMLPTSLLALLQETEYPPQRPSLLQRSTNRVLMVVDTVSPTPFALLRRARHFQYREEEDRALHDFSEVEDPIKALTEECRRVLRAISAANQSQVSSAKHSTGLRDALWSRFEDIGFACPLEEEPDDDETGLPQPSAGLRAMPASGTDLGRPTTPSWADFLSSGFQEENGNNPGGHLLPPDKVLPPIETAGRQWSSQSHRPRLESDSQLGPGELANIYTFDLDESFWWVWMSSLAPEETAERKSTFGRCAVVETAIGAGGWFVMEEMVKGAAPDPQEGTYVTGKKSSFFSWRRNKGLGRRKSTGKPPPPMTGNEDGSNNAHSDLSKISIGPDQHASIQAAVARLQAKQNEETMQRQAQATTERRGRTDDELMHERTNSVFTVQPVILKEASSAMKWAHKYDKEAIREAYLSNINAGRGLELPMTPTEFETTSNGRTSPAPVPGPSPAPVPVPATTTTTTNHGAIVANVPTPEPTPPLPAKDWVPERSEKMLGTGRNSPLPPVPEPDAGQEAEDQDQFGRENMMSPAPPTAAVGGDDAKKAKKLQKDNKEKSGGFRKLFGRSRRGSKLPENAAADVNAMLLRNNAATPEPKPLREANPQPAAAAAAAPQANLNSPTDPQAVREESFEEAVPPPVTSQAKPQTVTVPIHQEDPIPVKENLLPVPRQQRAAVAAGSRSGSRSPTPVAPHAPTKLEYTRSVDDDAARVDPADALEEEEEEEAREEFARFDQSPAPERSEAGADDSDDEAVPPPIARRKESSSEEHEDAAARSPQLNRWARIRTNAAERAAAQKQSEDKSRSGHSRSTEDEETSGEETIESRVARIKARVAELTSNMEGAPSPRTTNSIRP